jgi:ankyrin repeat protein
MAAPLHAAVDVGTRDSPDVFDLLVNVCGLDLEVCDRDGATCLYFASLHGNVFALRWLLDAGADANSVTLSGVTPLHNVRHYHCAVLLLAAGASVCARDDSGRTVLHSVPLPLWFESFEVTVVHPLIAAGCDLDAVDDDGETARELLARLRWTIVPDKVKAARRDIAKARVDFVRDRALQVCIGLQLLELNALQTCEILTFSCGPVAQLIPFHIWWKIATTVKHLQSK